MLKTIALAVSLGLSLGIASVASAAPTCPDTTGTDDGLQTDIHKKYAGRIVFAKQAIDRLKADEAAFGKTFSGGDSLYLRLYFARSLGNTCVSNEKNAKLDSTGTYQILLTIDGKPLPEPLVFRALGDPDGAKKWTTFQLAFNLAAGDDKSKREDAASWKREVKSLSPGSHAIRVEAWAADYDPSGRMRSKAPSAVGEFSLVIKEGEVIGATPLPQAAKRDEALEKSMLTAIKDAGWEEAPLKAIITASDWTVERDELDAIVARSIAATVAVKTTSGACRHFSLSFIQDRKSDAKYGPTKLKGTGESYDIACSAIGR